MEYKQNGKIFSYTKKILTVSFFSLILSLSLSEKGTFAAPENNVALTVESSNSASDGIDPSYKYKTDDKSDEKDKMAGKAYYVPNADGETASATVLEDQAIVFSRIKINSSQSEGQASKELKVNKITIGNRPPLGFSVIVLSKDDPKIEIEPPIGEKVSTVSAYLMDSSDKQRDPGDIFKLSENITAEDKGKISDPIKGGNTVRYLSLSIKPNDPSVVDNVGSDSSESMSDVVDESQSSDTGSKSGSESSSGSSTSGSSSSGSSSSNSSSSSGSYKSSSSSAGTTSSSSSSKSSSSTSKSSSSGSSSASKSASTKTFGSSFNPLFLFSGVCIPWLKKKKH